MKPTRPRTCPQPYPDDFHDRLAERLADPEREQARRFWLSLARVEEPLDAPTDPSQTAITRPEQSTRLSEESEP